MDKIDKIIKAIITGKDPYFGLSHFHPSNMADYTLMSTTIEDMVNVYGINEVDAADILQALTVRAAMAYKRNPTGEAKVRKGSTVYYNYEPSAVFKVLRVLPDEEIEVMALKVGPGLSYEGVSPGDWGMSLRKGYYTVIKY